MRNRNVDSPRNLKNYVQTWCSCLDGGALGGSIEKDLELKYPKVLNEDDIWPAVIVCVNPLYILYATLERSIRDWYNTL